MCFNEYLRMKVRPKRKNINSNKPSFYPYTILVNKCSGSCKNINDPYAKLGVPDVIKGMNIKVFNLMSRTYETCHIEWHESSVCNNKEQWNNDKCRC